MSFNLKKVKVISEKKKQTKNICTFVKKTWQKCMCVHSNKNNRTEEQKALDNCV